jgi:predicted Zn-dependent protease
MRSAAVAAAACLLAACSVRAPRKEASDEAAGGRRRTVLATEYDDRRAGEEQEREAIAELGLLRDPAIQAYVQQVGERLVPHAPERSFRWRFQVVGTWTPNAFALPGGAIFVSRGLLALTGSEDELANVLGHEIAHAALRHASSRDAFVRSTPFAFGWYGAGRVAAYARDQEREADRSGQTIAAAAGYDPGAMALFLRTLDQEERLELGAARLPSFLETHPATTERMASTSTRGQHMPWRASTGIARDRTDYLRRLDGLVVGADPAEGIFQGSRFLHPDLDLALRFPEGWKLLNTARLVAATSPERDARFVLESGGPGDDPKVAAGAFLAGEAQEIGARIEDARSLEVNGMPAYQVRGTALSPQGPVAGEVTWIAHGGAIYRLSVTSTIYAASRHTGRARAMVMSFRPLTPEEHDAFRVERMRVVEARAGDDLLALSRRHGNAWDVDRTAVLNGVLPSARFAAGEPVKIVVAEPYRPSPRPRTERPPAPLGS